MGGFTKQPSQLPCTISIRPLLSDEVLAEFHLNPPAYLLLVLLRGKSIFPHLSRGTGERSTHEPQSKGERGKFQASPGRK